jgi:hypothetical protein
MSEIAERGARDLSTGIVAQFAGTCRTVVQNALRTAIAAGPWSRRERRRRARAVPAEHHHDRLGRAARPDREAAEVAPVWGDGSRR